ncbi:anti-sigma-I factor RsgI6-like [Ruditapes philippinarum]|uniref:anti-sigma-I factor RsgI6-like n=1 Tax=Ruditapes philippinarum TaxID=129788 RepID=UPI00295A9CA6|nr:anti-sigma-I factor RsgI6-like [Ruditapes philippinarum]
MFSLLFLWCFAGFGQTLAGVELLKNYDMEMVHFEHNWSCKGGCTLISSKDHYSGWHSVMVSNRHHNFDALAQNVAVTPGNVYNFTAYIKLLNLQHGANYETVEATMTCLGNNGHKIYLKFGHDPYVRLNTWTLLGGIHQVPQGAHACQVVIQVKDPSVNYLVDHTSLQVVPENANWRTEANARIEELRKSDITVTFPSDQNENYQVELIQDSHEFAFGSAVGARQIVDPAYRKYAQAFYDNFEWAVLENALKWKLMEKTKGHIDYNTPMTALRALNGNGTKVRAHNIFWGVRTHVSSWVSTLSRQQLLQEIDMRTKGVVGHTAGLVKHWDVNNENIHGDWYEQTTGDPNITMKMFHDAHAVDPNVKLFLNDFGVMESYAAVPLRHQAEFFKSAGVPIYGVGIQSHIKDTNLDIGKLKGQLDTVASAGLPIWITELSLASNDVHSRATALTDILTLYFSHPAVEGVLFWGFWDGKIFNQQTALFEGSDVMPNEAGKAYQTLFKTTWRTHVTKDVNKINSFSVRGFKGGYTLIVRHDGREIKRETFTLGSTGKNININLGTSPSIIVG